MTSEKKIGNEYNTNGNDLVNFITKYQYSALQRYFKKVLEGMRKNDSLSMFRVEYESLLDAFQSCYLENQRKTCKICELTASNRLEIQKDTRSTATLHSEKMNDLKNLIKILQKDLYPVKEQRNELLDEIKQLNKPLLKEDKGIKVRSEIQDLMLCDKCIRENRNLPTTASVTRKVCNDDLNGNETKKDLESSILKSNLEILVADLKLTRNQILQLKKEIQKKDNHVKEYSKDLSESDTKLTEVQERILEIQNPVEISLKTYKRELEAGKTKFQKVLKDLQQANALNTKLSKEIESKESAISNLENKLKVAEYEHELAIKKANIFEQNIITSQNTNEALECELNALKEEVKLLRKKVATLQKATQDTFYATVELKVAQTSRRNNEIYKWQVISRKKRLSVIAEELKATSKMLESAKSEVYSLNKEKKCLETKIYRLKEIIKERNGEMNQMKDRSIDSMREVSDLTKENQLQQIKHQNIMERENKYYSLYIDTKTLVARQKNDITHLIKRQEYLVKILKQKDQVLEKLLAAKRCVCQLQACFTDSWISNVS